jgi:NAD(P)H-hydrate epimerase
MCLPAISKEQMIEVDNIMMKSYGIPVELMMEHAGEGLARLAQAYRKRNESIIVISGSGNNGGGGIVAGRRLHSWGIVTTILIPKRRESLRKIPKTQIERAEKLGINVIDGLEKKNLVLEDKLILDSYIGYGYTKRRDAITDSVFESLRKMKRIICLDAPSGLDINNGTFEGNFNPLATLTIAFMKIGLLRLDSTYLGDCFLVDIGVPAEVFRERLKLDWNPPYSLNSLDELYLRFQETPILNIKRNLIDKSWKILSQ